VKDGAEPPDIQDLGGLPEPEAGDTFLETAGMVTRTTMKQPGEGALDAGTGEFTLLVMSAEAFASFPLPRSGTIVVGRSTKCDVQVDDPLASRQHARLHLGSRLEIEDLHSANQTRVRDRPLTAGGCVPLAWGEAIGIGSTVLVVERSHRAGAPRRIWSHRFFEGRLRQECDRPLRQGRAFALVRLHFDTPITWVKVVPLIDRDVPPPNVFAAYGPNDYEVLLFDVADEDAAEIVGRLRASMNGLGVASRAGIAWYPRDGRTADALLAKANALLLPEDHRRRPDVRLGQSAAMLAVTDLATRAAKSNINVLILGETGAGKEVVAHAIHQLSNRAQGPFLPINCAGLSDGLLESELFGYERGAFTGAVQPKKGLFETARGGTLFLDEIGEMPLAVQARVLRAIANREILPLGALKPRSTDVRIVAATNRDLLAETSKGTFRRDLYYRLNGLTLTVPPLRERREEIPELVSTFLADAAREAGFRVPDLSVAARQMIEEYDWPGNVRELKNVVERALVLAEGGTIRPEHLSLETPKSMVPPLNEPGVEPAAVRRPLTPSEVEERETIINALRFYVWNQSRAARSLNMPRRTFVAKLDRYGIPRPQKGSGPQAPSDKRDRNDKDPD
jgi:DNA-binding NtrC family response regulator